MMKKMLILTGCLIFGMGFLVWKSVGGVVQNEYVAPLSGELDNKCGSGEPRSFYLMESDKEGVRKLGELEGMCGSEITNKIAIKVNIPTSKELARINSTTLTNAIIKMKDKNLKPLIFIEASQNWTSGNFNILSAGGYDAFITEMLMIIGESGIEENDIYGWIVIPQPNLPNWDSHYISPELFSKYYLIVYENIKRIFPANDIGVMFNTSTYQEQPVDWSNRDYRTLATYIIDIPKEKINILGVEGYPSIPEIGNPNVTVLKPSEYLPKFLIEELYLLTEAKKIIIGTNTFSAQNINEKENIVFLPADKRGEILTETVDVLKTYNVGKAEVSVLMGTPVLTGYKDVDWEYFGTQYNQNVKNKTVILNFMRGLYKNKIGIIFGY